MDADETAARVAIDAGEAPLTWDVWSARVESSAVLTNSGKQAVRSAVDQIAEFLGPDWLTKFRTASQTNPEAKALPLISTDWCPATDNRHAHERILTLAAQLRLLSGAQGLAPVRRSMRRDLGQFEHSLLQLEVASLAVRDGWRVTFEPKPDPAGTRATDLRLQRNGDVMLVEVKGFLLDDWVRNDLRLASKIRMSMLRLEIEHHVHFSGSNGSPDSDNQVDRWLADLELAAIEVARDGQPRDSTAPFGGRIAVGPGLPPNGTSQTMPIRRRVEWDRIRDQIEKKAEQGRGSEPLWLRFEETAQFWALAAPQDKRQDWIEAVAGAVERQLASHDHVAGMMLSGPARAYSTQVLRQSFPVLDGKGCVLSCTTAAPFWRESLFVPGAHPAAAGQLPVWSGWYLDEATWLDWALGQLGDIPLAAIFMPTNEPT